MRRLRAAQAVNAADAGMTVAPVVRNRRGVPRVACPVLLRWALLVGFLLLAGPAWAASTVLTWMDNATNETTFHIERKAEACAGTAPFVEIAAVGVNVVTFTDTAITEGVTYCYRVAASNPAGKSGYSNTASRTVPFSIPAAPSQLGATSGP